MKHPFIRRGLALALALVFALSLSIPLTAPARADDLTLSIKVPEGTKWPLVVGDTITLEAVWSSGTNPAEEPSGVRYSWDCTDTDEAVLELSEKTGKSITVTAKGSGSAAITLTASQLIEGELKQIGTAKLEQLSVTSLVIKLANVTAGESAQLVVGQGETTLKADWSNGTPAGVKAEDITYTWACSGDTGAVTWPADGSSTDSAKVKAATAGTANVTVKAAWGDSRTAEAKCDLKVIGPELEGIEILIGSKLTTGSADLVVGGKAQLEAKWANDQRPSGVTVTYKWEITGDTDAVTLDKTTGNPVNVTAKMLELDDLPQAVTITVTASWGDGGQKQATCTLNIKAVAAESIKLDQETLTLAVDESATLTATVLPENASNKDIVWESSDDKIATVTQNGVVTGVAVGGPVTITASSGDVKATCTVYVTSAAPSIEISGPTTIIFTSKTTSWTLTARPSNLPEGAKTEIRWSVSYFETGKEKYTKLPQFKGPDGNPQTTGTGEIVTIVSNGAGEFIFTAEVVVDGKVVALATKRVTISGIVLAGPMLGDDGKLNMYVGDSTTLTAEVFGDAGSVKKVEWNSSDPSVVSVMNNTGNLNAWGIGRASITVTRGDYSAICVVEVGEDTSVVLGPYTSYMGKRISPSNPPILSALYSALNAMSQRKTAEHGQFADEVNKIGYGLDYITNLYVSPNQGTLYFNYSTESNTGAGVGTNDQFAQKAGGSKLSLDRLYFVPKQGFVGTAEITFNAVALNRTNFSGVIRMEVGADVSGSGSGYQISYLARAGEPVQFLADDFNAYCQQHPSSYRSFSYITFNLPKASEGVLYYNYIAGSGSLVSSSIQFTQTGRYTIDNVCFVPNPAYEGEVIISFRAVDTAGDVVNGTLTVNVISASVAGDSSVVTVVGERGRPVTLQSEMFNAACKETIYDTLHFVTFDLPGQTEGTLYYNYQSNGTYESRVTPTDLYYYSGVPGLGGVTFVPASNAAGRIAISYTGYGVGGASFRGTLYISLEEVDRSTIYYTVPKGGVVTFSLSDFNAAAQRMAGSNVSYVIFRGASDSGRELGSLRHRTNSTGTANQLVSWYSSGHTSSSSYVYYASPTSSQRGLGRVFFQANNTVGSVTITYTAYRGTPTGSASNHTELYTGKIVIQVGADAPADAELSCNTGGNTSTALLALQVYNACDAAMKGSLDYIEITSVPASDEGHLYFNYDYRNFGSGTVVKAGDRFYRTGSPGISQLTFVPFARFAGKAEITYIGYSADRQEQVSGRIIVNVTKSTVSYFNDMSRHTWAVDSVEYLRRNGTVQGVGDGRYSPGGTVKRGDFVLMLVRAYGLTATGGSPFSDVPAGKYYANAIGIAYQLGIVSGNNGKFKPEDDLTRQDAMVMIYKTLKATGKTTTNGLAADLSGYYDEGEIASYAREAMGSLIQMGVVAGDGSGYLTPRSRLNRAQAAILLHAMMTL